MTDRCDKCAAPLVVGAALVECSEHHDFCAACAAGLPRPVGGAVDPKDCPLCQSSSAKEAPAYSPHVFEVWAEMQAGRSRMPCVVQMYDPRGNAVRDIRVPNTSEPAAIAQGLAEVPGGVVFNVYRLADVRTKRPDGT